MPEAKKRSMTLDGHFLKADIYEYASGERRLDVVYLDSLNKREVILTEQFASQELLYEAFVDAHLAATLSAQARQLVPAISLREERNLAEMANLQFEARDVKCSYCGARPGELCHDSSNRCQTSRVEDLHHFLIWLAEQHRQTKRLTKKLIVEVAEMHGYNTAENLYCKSHGVILTQWSTADCWTFYVGGRLDPTKSVWMTRGPDLSDPERGPFRNVTEIARAMRAMGRGE
jgi:hypothetical protein